jgi:hypothetical protein
VQRLRDRRVVGPERRLADRQRPPVDLLGLVEATAMPGDVRQRVQALGQLRGVAEQPLADRHGPGRQRLGRLVVAADVEERRQRVQRAGQGQLVVRLALADREGVLEQRLRGVVEPEHHVHATDRLRERGLGARLPAQRLDLLRALVEDLAGGDRVAARLARIRDLEEADEEFGDLPGRRRLLAGAIPLARDPRRLDGRHHRERDEQHQQARRDAHADPMPPHELACAVGRARRPGADRLVAEIPAEIVGELGRGPVAPSAVLVERLHRDPVEVAAKLGRQPAGGRAPAACGVRGGLRVGRAHPRARTRRLVLADSTEDLLEAPAPQLLRLERQHADEQLVHEHAQGVDVGARVDLVARELCLLGAHVLRRPDQLAVLGEERALGETLGRRLGDAEVDDLRHRPVVPHGHQDVARLDVAVDDGLLVGVLEPFAHLHEQLEPGPRAQPLPVAVVGDGHAVHVLHDEERTAVLRGARIEDARDVGMVHHRERLALRLEPRDDLLRLQSAAHDLQRDPPADRAQLVSQVDLAHPALADLLERPVVTDLVRDLRGRRRVAEGRGLSCRRGRLVVEQRLQMAEQLAIFAAGILQEDGPRLRVELESAAEEPSDLLETFAVHGPGDEDTRSCSRPTGLGSAGRVTAPAGAGRTIRPRGPGARGSGRCA